jgi:hypothetical protein
MLKTAGALAFSWGCSATPPTEASTPAPPALPSTFQNKCDATKGQLRPLVVEWSAPDRAALEAQARHGQLVVHYQGCELELLRSCTAPEKFAYRYTAITPKDELVTMRDANQLYATIPVHAASFEGKLAQKGELNAAMRIVGMYEAPSLAPGVDELVGDCSRATHVVSALAVGAFEFFAGASSEAGAHAKIFSVEAGGEQTRTRETLSRDGDVKACGSSKRGDPEPPDNCGASLRLELAAVRPATPPPQCQPGTELVGRECKPVEKRSELAPEDRSFVDAEHGTGWGNRCYAHYKAGLLPFARAACQKALEQNPEPKVRGAILHNVGLTEEAGRDPKAACAAFRESLAVRPGIKQTQQKYDELGCRELLSR